MTNNITSRVQSMALTSTQLEKRLLNVDTVSQLILSKEIIAQTLQAKSQQFLGFKPSGLLEYPKDASAMRVIGLISMTATFMLNKELNDFVFCNEDMATAIHSKMESSKYYRFLHGGQIDPKDSSKGTDLLIKPDGMVVRLFDVDSENCASDEMIVKLPRTAEQLRAERVSKEVKRQLYGDLNFSVFPHLTNKSYYSSNPEAADELELTRERVARALARSNPKAAQGQICQAVILGFVSSFYVMSKMYYESLKRQAKGENIETAPMGLGVYMPAWTILSNEIIRPQSGELDKLRERKAYGGVNPVMSYKKTCQLLGLPTGNSPTTIKPLVSSQATGVGQTLATEKNHKQVVECLKENPTDSLLLAVDAADDADFDVANDKSPLGDNIKHDCQPEKEAEAVKEITKKAMSRIRKKAAPADLLGLGNLPPVASNSTSTVEDNKKEEPKVLKRRRPGLSADDDAKMG